MGRDHGRFYGSDHTAGHSGDDIPIQDCRRTDGRRSKGLTQSYSPAPSWLNDENRASPAAAPWSLTRSVIDSGVLSPKEAYLSLRSKWAAGKTVRAGLAVGRRLPLHFTLGATNRRDGLRAVPFFSLLVGRHADRPSHEKRTSVKVPRAIHRLHRTR